MAREWDASTYDRIADPMTRWGAAVLDRVDLAGDERVLDAGCGSGRVTELLLERLPRGSIVAVDGSSAMIEEARTRLVASRDRVELVVADLLQPLPVREPVDAVFSTATFHWIRDHDSLFRNLALVLKPGGQLVAQCGGRGNIARLVAVVRELGLDWDEGPTYFAGPEETRERLAAAGFEDIQCWLHDEPTPIERGEPLETYLRTVCLGGHLDRIPEAERNAFVRGVAARLPVPELDYVRLNITARRSDPPSAPP